MPILRVTSSISSTGSNPDLFSQGSPPRVPPSQESQHSPPQLSLSPTIQIQQTQSQSQGDWWEIRCVLGERRRRGRLEYQVDWAPHPVTGETYPPDWILAVEVNSVAREEWNLCKQQVSRLGSLNSSTIPQRRPANRNSRVVITSSDTSALYRHTRSEITSAHPFDSRDQIHSHSLRNSQESHAVISISSSASNQQSAITADSQASGSKSLHLGLEDSEISARQDITVQVPDHLANSCANKPDFVTRPQSITLPFSHPEVDEIPDSQEEQTSLLSPFGNVHPVSFPDSPGDSVFRQSQTHIPSSILRNIESSQSSRAPQDTPSRVPSSLSLLHLTSSLESPSRNHPFIISGVPATSLIDAADSPFVVRSYPNGPVQSSHDQVFLSQVPPRGFSGSDNTSSLLRPFQSIIEDSIPVTSGAESALNSAPQDSDPGPHATAESLLMSHLPPRSTQSLASAEHGHKRNLSSPGSQPLVKRTRVIGGITASLAMDMDDSVPFSSVDEFINNHQTPYDPARPIIVTVADYPDHDNPFDDLIKPHAPSVSEPFSLLQTSPDPLPPSIPVSSGTTGSLDSTADHAPMISGVVSPSALEFTPTMDSGPLLPGQNPDLLTVAPSDISRSVDMPYVDHIRGSPHLDTSPVQAPIIDAPMESSQPLYDEVFYEGEREFLVTLPFASSQRPQYIDVIESFKAQNKEYSRIFFEEEYRPPRASLVHQIDEEFITLLDICDYPHELADKSLSDLSDKEIQHYAVESNAKFNFLWEFLHETRDTDKNILIIARSERLIKLLKLMILIQKIAVSTSTLDETDYSRATSSSTVVLAHSSAEIRDPLTSFQIVIGFDYMFRSSIAARQIEAMDPRRQPFVLTLMMLHSIEHLDVSMVKDRGVLEHKNAVVFGLVQGRDIVRNPRLSDYEKPHEIAFHFAEQVKDPNPHFAWDSQSFPKEIIDGVYISPQNSQANSVESGAELKPITSRKRKMTGDKVESSKRLKTTESNSPPSNILVNAERHAAVKPFVQILGLHVLDVSNAWNDNEITIPQRLLTKMCQKVTEDQRILQRERNTASDLQKVVQSMGKHINDYGITLELESKRLGESVQERAKFQIERDATAKENKALKAEVAKLKEQLQASQAKEKALSEEITTLKAPPPTTTDNPSVTAATTSAAIQVATTRAETAETKLASIEKRYASQSTEMDFFRQAYQDASNAASKLRNENNDLTSQLAAAQLTASENLLRIHDTNMKTQTEQLMRMVEEARTIQREREVDLERLREELKVYKNGRRETRQSSAPRSPRVGMMSPRNAGFRGAAAASSSRGTSPATNNLEPGQYYSQQGSSGRWGHLKD